jgi:hypothetical protein
MRTATLQTTLAAEAVDVVEGREGDHVELMGPHVTQPDESILAGFGAALRAHSGDVNAHLGGGREGGC